ncbi:uncharacterized protein [Dermacentor andersoni]|uniref:uncharacterized protein n=1 Tax=Dermacentor andersoni TaxID=34620 RepID=UPI003B3B7C58
MDVLRTMPWLPVPSLAVSFTMCTRMYKPKSALNIDSKCEDSMMPPNSTAEFCNFGIEAYRSPMLNVKQHTIYAITGGRPDLLATYDNADTINWKMCSVKRRYRGISLGMALFDIECEDWANVCHAHTKELANQTRIRAVVDYFRNKATVRVHSNVNCP